MHHGLQCYSRSLSHVTILKIYVYLLTQHNIQNQNRWPCKFCFSDSRFGVAITAATMLRCAQVSITFHDLIPYIVIQNLMLVCVKLTTCFSIVRRHSYILFIIYNCIPGTV